MQSLVFLKIIGQTFIEIDATEYVGSILFQWSVVYTSFRRTTIPSDFLYMQENKTIQSIDLQWNEIGPEGAKSIATALEAP